ncbi:MAG: DUF2993 domain-containing protein [Roseiflexus sp.]|nr:DUF2993 domain-containing protein [Roseiflexus sp.]MCS7288591.1 DUF2993 domain-containing protein [Roseiflexus sp.]MDW8145270.1 hypothetical protein [Roseiflexaceae bacterium]MDW8232028.1 hypothetical protein [Roseiflexaceae bacterium]
MTKHYRPVRRQTRARRGVACLGWITALIWVFVALVATYMFVLRPSFSRMVGEQAAQRLDVGGAPDGGGALPTLVAALPTGELRISEQEINTYLLAHTDLLAPIEQATVRLVSGGLEVDIRAFGLDGTARLGVALQNGRVIALDPRLDGPLGRLVSLDDLLAPIERQLNELLDAQGRRITDLRIEPGELIVTITDA